MCVCVFYRSLIDGWQNTAVWLILPDTCRSGGDGLARKGRAAQAWPEIKSPAATWKKKPAQQSVPVVLGGRDGQMPGTCCSNSLAQSVSLGTKKKAHLQCRHTLLLWVCFIFSGRVLLHAQGTLKLTAYLRLTLTVWWSFCLRWESLVMSGFLDYSIRKWNPGTPRPSAACFCSSLGQWFSGC